MEGEFSGFIVGGAVLLTIMLVILKVTDTIDMSWLWVFAPCWMVIMMVCGFVIILLGLFAAVGGMSSQEAKQRAMIRATAQAQQKAEDEPEK